MKTADLYYNVSGDNKEIIISGEYSGGTWRISFTHNDFNGCYCVYKTARHTRGLTLVGQTKSLVVALGMTEDLNEIKL